MRRALASVLLLLGAAALASPVLAAGIQLSWDHCAADGRVGNRTFACDSNAGFETVIASYDPPVSANAVGVEFVFDLCPAAPALPAWWAMRDLGSCRQASLQIMSAAPQGPSACVDPYGGQATGGITVYSTGYAGPGCVRFRGAIAVPAQTPFSFAPGTEYFAFGLVIDHARTVGPGACAGCDETVCLGLAKITLMLDDLVTRVVLLGHAASGISWQGGSPTYTVAPEKLGPDGIFSSLVCLGATPTRRQAWGAVKALYR